MKRALLLLALLGGALASQGAQPVRSFTRFCATCGVWGADTFSSESGQFIVHGRVGPKIAPRMPNLRNTPLIELEPQLAAVTAERVKRAVLLELGEQERPGDKVHIILLDLAPPEQPVGIVSKVYPDGFQYQMTIPTFLEEKRAVKALVQVELLELANHSARRCAELPAWLHEGFAREIMSGVLPAVVVNEKPLTVEKLGYDRLSASRAFLQTNSPLTIQELSFPVLNSELDRLRFEASSHLLVYELLRLKSGREMMQRFLRDLPRALNWQTAFYSSFGHYFNTPLDLEKWWTLNWLDVKGKQQRELWSLPLSLERLNAFLLTPMELRLQTNAIPQKHEATLQEVLYNTDFGMHRDILARKLQQLVFLSVNLDPNAAGLATGYERALRNYLQKRTNDVQPGLRSDPARRLQQLLESTIDSLDDLDRMRDTLQRGGPKALAEVAGQMRRK